MPRQRAASAARVSAMAFSSLSFSRRRSQPRGRRRGPPRACRQRGQAPSADRPGRAFERMGGVRPLGQILADEDQWQEPDALLLEQRENLALSAGSPKVWRARCVRSRMRRSAAALMLIRSRESTDRASRRRANRFRGGRGGASPRISTAMVKKPLTTLERGGLLGFPCWRAASKLNLVNGGYFFGGAARVEAAPQTLLRFRVASIERGHAGSASALLRH